MNAMKQMLKGKSHLIPRIFIVSIVCMMLATVLTGLTTVSNVVTIHENGSAYSRYTIYTEAEDILENQEIQLGKNDSYEFTGFSDHEADLYIYRAFDVTVTADGETKTVSISKGTVQDALDLAGVTVSDDDLINVGLNEEVTQETEIVVNRVTYTEAQSVEPVAYDVVIPETPLVANQTLVVTTPGQNGEKVVTTRTRWIDGVEAETTVIAEQVTKEPVSEVQTIMDEVYIGGKKQQVPVGSMPELDANGNPVNYAYKVTGKATAYSALGKKTSLQPGDVAMNLSQFPKGTKLYIKTPNGGYVYGYSTVRDTGVAVNNGTVLVDCFFGSYAESVQFGAKTVEVYVLN
ncbi:MAG: ubiquitin-like domain-containing protein [Massiliimalia sp.]|jgi:uncharacterized protein YabE (DUF348 family)/3D (Asp-Asp-Asp) domain-containing protein